ncbi:MAG: cation-translocating P-type ATPase [Prevotella sp.]|nr:cation-translocating P-type ATPase [Prevotella sp.]
MERIVHQLEGMRMTVVSGIALAASLVLLLAGVRPAFDPAWITVVISGVPLLYLAVTRLVFQRWISSALLITIAMVACLYIGQLFAAGEVAFIMAIGALLEDYTVRRAKRGISRLVSLVPDKGRRITLRDGREEEELVAISEVRRGDVLRVLPGERITVDGDVVSGATSVDQSIMTGESVPVDKTAGDRVFCGTMNCYGSIDIRAAKTGEDTSLQKMIDLVREAEKNKAPMQRIVDKWAAWLVPVALLIAVGAWIATGELVRGVTVMVVFCPCALALATPVSIVAGIGQATKFGVLVKSGEALERMGKVDCITFDKTGTLTEGALTVSDIVCLDTRGAAEEAETRLLALAAAVEGRSEHPIGKAIAGRFNLTGKPLPSVDNFRAFPGKGVRATAGGRSVVCGKSAYIEECGVALDESVRSVLARFRGEGKVSVVVAADGRAVGLLALSDVLRSSSEAVVAELNAMNITTVMLTGDNRRAAEYLASRVGIRDVRAELLPEGKVSAVKEYQTSGRTVCMVGDGVNDAPAMKTADVCIAPGTIGSDVAIDTADIALVGDDISKIPYIVRLSKAVIRSIKLNITLSMIINFIAITLSVLGLLNPVTGALVHNAGSVLVVLNAALLYDRKI